MDVIGSLFTTVSGLSYSLFYFIFFFFFLKSLDERLSSHVPWIPNFQYADFMPLEIMYMHIIYADIMRSPPNGLINGDQ